MSKEIKCHKSGECLNYPEQCRECWTISDFIDPYPMFQAGLPESPVHFKTFFGSSMSPAERSANTWLENNRRIEIVDFRFTAYPQGHAICVLYKERVTET